MRIVYIDRNKGLSNTKQSLGIFHTINGNEIFTGKSLELGWLNNQNDVSCIPVGEYTCRWTRSNRLSKAAGKDVYTYEVLDVPNRAGIRIHSANYFYQLKGCIAFGSANKDINADGLLDNIHSGDTVNKFNEIMNKEDFKLIIREAA